MECWELGPDQEREEEDSQDKFFWLWKLFTSSSRTARGRWFLQEPTTGWDQSLLSYMENMTWGWERKPGWVMPSARTRFSLPHSCLLFSTPTFRNSYQLTLPRAGHDLYFSFCFVSDLLILQLPFLFFDHLLSWQKELQGTIYDLLIYFKTLKMLGKELNERDEQTVRLSMYSLGRSAFRDTYQAQKSRRFCPHSSWICIKVSPPRHNKLSSRTPSHLPFMEDKGPGPRFRSMAWSFWWPTPTGNSRVTSVEQEMFPSLRSAVRSRSQRLAVNKRCT